VREEPFVFFLFMQSQSDHLDDLMRSWTTVPRPAPGTAAEVWRAIHSQGIAMAPCGVAARAVRALDLWLARPQTIAALVAVALLLGAGLAEMRAQYEEVRIDNEMSARYLALIEPVSR
jgi:hypothetical protein